MSGTLALKGRVARDGSVKSVAVTRSSIGSYEVERCIIGVVKDMKLPAPQGGEGEFSCPVEFTSSERARQVQSWPEAKVATEMARHQGEVTTCLKRRRPLRGGHPRAPPAAAAEGGRAGPLTERLRFPALKFAPSGEAPQAIWGVRKVGGADSKPRRLKRG